MEIKFEITRLTAAELALLSKMDIGQYNRELAAKLCEDNCGTHAAHRMQVAALKAIDEISTID